MTTTTLRPNGISYKNQTVTISGAASETAAVNDNSDTSYIQATVGGSTIYFSLDDVTLAANQRVRYISTRIRNAAASGSSVAQKVVINCNNCSNGNYSVAVFTSSRTTTAINTYSSSQSNSAPTKTAYAIPTATNVNNMCIGVEWFTPTSGSFYQRIYELYVDLDVNSQPTVAAPSVTGTTTSTPTVTWVYADADGDPQSHYWVKIFTQAQVAAGGFNADTTTPIWQTGDSTGLTSSIVTGTLTGGTYTAYVKVAQDWPVVLQGTLWWSAWATTNFTIASIPPYPPVIQSAQVLQDANQYRTVLSVFAPVNLITSDSSDFEGGLGQFAALANCAVIRDTAQFANGGASMKMTSTAAGDMTAQCALDFLGNPHVDGGQTYTAVAQFRANTSTRSCAVGVQWLDSSGANIGAISYGSNVTDSAANFSALATFTGTAPGNARSAKVTVKVVATGAGAEIHWVDKVDVHAGSTIGWMPGGYANNQGGVIVQRGEYLDDRPGTIDNWMHPQVASAGSVLRTAGYGFSWDTTASTVSWKWLDKAITGSGTTPPGALDWAPQTATASALTLGINTFGGTSFLTPCLANQVHVASCWMWTSLTTQTAAIRIRWYDALGAFISTSANVNATLTTAPQQLVTTATAPSNAMLAAIELVNVNSDNTRHFYVTRIGFGLGVLPVDGRQPMGVDTGFTSDGSPVGPHWTNVRYAADGSLVDNQTLAGFPEAYGTGQVDVVVDHEYPPGRPVQYRASITYSYAGTNITSPYSNYVTVYNAPPAVTLLRSITTPTLQVAVNRRKDTSYSFSDDSQIFHPLGANAAPIKVRDWYSGADGTLVVITSTDGQAARLNALTSTNDVLLIQWAQGGRTYCIISDRQLAEILSSDIDFCDADGQTQAYLRYVVWSVSYLETVAP